MLDKNIFRAGEDQVILDRSTKGVWTITIKHNCKIVDRGLRYLLDIQPGVEKLLNEYNKMEIDDKKKQ